MAQQKPWERYAGAIAGDPVIAPPDPYKQADEQRDQVRTDIAVQQNARDARSDALSEQLTTLSIQEKQAKVAEEAAKAEKAANAQSTAARQLANVIDKIDQVAIDSSDNGGWGETGFTGSLLRSIPGTPAKDLAANVQTIDANAAFNALAEMRANSPTGGALGAVSERELALLQSSVTNLDPSQSQQQFFTNLAEAKKLYLDMLARIDPDAAAAYNDKPGIRFNEDGSANLVYVQGEDRREPTDPLGVMNGGPSGGGGGGGNGMSDIALGLAQGTGSIVEGAGDVVGIVTNPIGQMLYNALGYDQRYDTGQILREAVGLPKNQSELGDAVIGGATAALSGAGAARGALGIATSPVVRNALSVVGRTPIRDAAAGAGAGAGAVIGDRMGGAPGAAIGTLAGGLVGYGAANRLAGVAPRQPNALAMAAQRQNVDLLPADAGGPVAKAITTGTKASPLSVGPVVRQAGVQQDQMRAATRRAAESQGTLGTTEQAGEGIRSAAQRFTQQTSQRASRLYDRANQAAKGVRIKPLQTIARLDEHIQRLKSDPSAPPSAVQELERFRDNVAGGVNVSGLRDARTRLSQGVYDGNLRSGAEQAMWKDILGNLSSDIDAGLRQAGRANAANQFRRADAFWRERVEHIDQVLQPILGRDRSGEQIVSAIESMARGQSGGNARLSRLLSNMTPEEAGQVRATVIDRLGRSNPGAQDAEGTAYSAATFLTNWNKMTPQAKASLFSDAQLRGNLNDLATLASGMKQSQSMANFSNTGIAVGSNVAVGMAAATANPALALLGGGAQYLTGRLMASPAFARLLARTSKMPANRAQRSFSEQIGVLAAREPLLAGDLRSVQEALVRNGANDNALIAGAAAEEREQPDQ